MIPPARLTAGLVEWDIARVWPGREPGAPLTVEARSRDEVRGGHWSAAAGLRLMHRGEDPRLPDLAGTLRTGRLVGHRPGRRAVVRVHDGYVKIVRPGRADDVAAAHARGGVFGVSFAVGEARRLSDGAVWFAAVPGRNLDGMAASADDAEWERLWRAWALAWPRAVATAGVHDWPSHTAEDERGVLETWAAHAAAVDPDPVRGGRVRAAARRIADRLAALPAVGPVAAHRDLHDQQLLWDPAHGLGLIDFDTAALADPALDLGNLAAHIDLAHAQGRWGSGRAAVAHGAVERAARQMGVPDERLSAWRIAARLRVACLHRLRPRWRSQADADLTALLGHPLVEG